MKDSKFRRGQIWWLEGYEAHTENGKKRPFLIVSNDMINSNMANLNITVVPITSNLERANIKTNVVFERYTNIKNVIKCGEIVTVYKEQLISYESSVDDEVMEKVKNAIYFALGIETLEEVQPAEESVVEPIVEPVEPVEIERLNGRIIWNIKNIETFMKMHKEEGVSKTSEQFNLSKSTIYTLITNFKKKYPQFA